MQGTWATGAYYPRIDWNISTVGGHWLYEYTLTSSSPSPSHWIMEVTGGELTFDVDTLDMFNIYVNTNYLDEYVETNPGDGTQSQPNPWMPEDLFGVRWDSLEDIEPEGGEYILYFSFESQRNPVWGDFYVKAGGTANPTAFWNAGFALDDPEAAPQSGTINNHILRPNGYVPEPGTSALLGIGLAALIGGRLRRRRV